MELTKEDEWDIKVAVESLKDDVEHGWGMTTQKDKIMLLKYLMYFQELVDCQAFQISLLKKDK